MSSAKELFAKINNASASASSHPLAALNLTGEFLAKDYNYKNATTFGSLTGSYKWSGGVLAPNGKIYGIPCYSTTILEIDTGCIGNFPWALQPYVNKY